ncbi:MAG: pyridoxamine 5'-phosphate oxidase [Verrucomicrobia bacterium]|nr:pyridoxamine 5'-phosphate oxidase [Verrucomicrobiota bacterium]
MSIRAKLFSLKGLLGGLHEKALPANPIDQFNAWYRAACRLALPQPDAFTLATADAEGRPTARVLLLKGVDEAGFVFYTNYESRKAVDIEANSRATMVFLWTELYRQVRVEGRLERVSTGESDAYFASRWRGSQIGAWASKQSSEIARREMLEQKYRDYKQQFAGKPVPRPPNWGGYRLVPERIEFWQGRPSRLHDRLCYLREKDGWRVVRLSP